MIQKRSLQECSEVNSAFFRSLAVVAQVRLLLSPSFCLFLLPLSRAFSTLASNRKLQSGLGMRKCFHIRPTLPRSVKHNVVTISSSFRAVIGPVLCFDTNNIPTRARPQEVWVPLGVAQWGGQFRSFWTTSAGVRGETARSLLAIAATQAALSSLQAGAAVQNRQEMKRNKQTEERHCKRWHLLCRCLFMLSGFCFWIFFVTFQSVGGINHISGPPRRKFAKCATNIHVDAFGNVPSFLELKRNDFPDNFWDWYKLEQGKVADNMESV